MQPETPNCMNYEGMPPMMFVSPPPPGPPPFPLAAGPLVNLAPPPPPPPIQRMPIAQPPPPPPPPLTAPSTSAIQTPTNYSGPPPIMPPPFEFDASRPPPPLPGQCRNGKRKFDPNEAGPSKMRKSEEPKADPCENCVQREIRISFYKQQMEKLQCEEEYQRLLLQVKSEEFENGKEILRSIVSPERYRILEEFIEGGPPQVTDVFAQLQNTLTLLTENSVSSATVPRHFLIQLMEYIFEIVKRQNDTQPSTSLRLEDTLSQALSIPRRTNNVSARSSMTEVLHTVLELLCNDNNSSERSLESRLETQSSSSQTNNGFINGQSSESSSLPGGCGRFTNVSNTTVRSYTNVTVPPISTGSNPPPAQYPVFHPGVALPLNRPYFPQMGVGAPTAGGSMSSMAVSRPPVPPAPPAQQHPPRPPVAHAPTGMPPNPQGYPPYMMGRFPHPPNFYPPYQ